MRGHRDYLGGLTQLGRTEDADERRALWRQSMATLANEIAVQRPVPLEGYDPEALRRSIDVCIATKLIDELDFLSRPAAAASLYELAAALPDGPARRQLGRRVLGHLYDGDAATFVALATQMAVGSPKALSGAPVRARVALSLALPLGAGARADVLALALISRKEVEREWLTLPSTGSLSSRRLAARLLERAAREAARRAGEGDESGLRVFQTDSVQAAWTRLLSDRESLVWRHVATARGLLSEAVPEHAGMIERHLETGLTPTEWRRAAASIAARIAVAPKEAMRAIHAFLEGGVIDRDRGVAGAMILGLPRAAETEPEIVEELLPKLIQKGGLDATEALVELRRERLGGDVGAWASELARAELREMAEAGTEDDGSRGLVEALYDELADEAARNVVTLPDKIGLALMAFAEKGPRPAHEAAHELVEAADGTLGMIELTREDREGRVHICRALRELDLAVLEKGTLLDLLMLGAKPGGQAPAAEEIDALFGRLSHYLTEKERAPIDTPGPVPHMTYRIRRMRALLHLVDVDEGFAAGQAAVHRARRLETVNALLGRVTHDEVTPLRRITCAAASRACDALVREDICEVSDIVLAAGRAVHDDADLTVFAEATMDPEIEATLRAYLALGEAVQANARSGASERASIDALRSFAHALPVATSPRVEALRGGVIRLAAALEDVAMSSSLRELAEGSEGTLLAPLEAAVMELAQLAAGAQRRLGGEVAEAPASGAAIRMVDFAVERAIRGNRESLGDAIGAVRESLQEELLPRLADVTLFVLERVRDMPLDAVRRTRMSFVPKASIKAPLPAWLPPGRTLGGFYVLRSLGAGAGGSVFVARRAEQKGDEGADRFALKVPEYDGAAAQTLSEKEFLDMFRDEAGALLSLPAHENLAGFVTFDAGAQPKPILVMELVEGPTLERALSMEDIDVDRAFEIIEGIADGLMAMHKKGIGHLDVKPSNVILRDPDGLAGPLPPREPVLVDFGLAGRHVRPGCATGNYGAPEIWGAFGEDAVLSPLPADVYAFGCVAYELLTGKTLFDAQSPIALITSHLAHDGRPEAIETLAGSMLLEPLAEVLETTLRRQPADRAAMVDVKRGLGQLRRTYAGASWPLGASL